MSTSWIEERTRNAAYGARTGRLAGIDPEGRLVVRTDGGRDAHEVAIIGVELDDDALARAVAEGRRVLLLDPAPEGSPPVVVALLRERVAATRRAGRLQIAAPEELVFRCGKASVTLRADGRVTIRGTHVVSASSGPNKIKGASIALN